MATSKENGYQAAEYGDQRVERGDGGETHQAASDGAPRLTTQQGIVGRRRPEHAAGRRARPGAAGGLPLPREDLPLRPRADPRAGGARPRLRGARLLRELRAADRHHPGRPVPERRASARRSSSGSPPSPATRAPPTWPATCAASRRSSTPGRATGTSSATTSRCSSSRTRSSSRTSSTPSSRSPTAASRRPSRAHDNFWDFVSLMPESTHMLMWVMSDRAIPRSFRFMEGFGVHTFRLVNAEGRSTFVKFHWKPKLGLQSVVWNEAREDQRRRPRLPPPRPVGRHHQPATSPSGSSGCSCSTTSSPTGSTSTCSTPPRSSPRSWSRSAGSAGWCSTGCVDNFFAETEQVAFCTQNIVPGIDFTNDPLLQGRNFSYLDTQLKRLGSPNFTHLRSTRRSARSRTSSRTATWP